MRFIAISLIVFLKFILYEMASPPPQPRFLEVPYGMAEFAPFHGKNLSLVMPLTKDLTQLERLNLSENCKPFRRRCSMAEQCCSRKCLVYIQRCDA